MPEVRRLRPPARVPRLYRGRESAQHRLRDPRKLAYIDDLVDMGTGLNSPPWASTVALSLPPGGGLGIIFDVRDNRVSIKGFLPTADGLKGPAEVDGTIRTGNILLGIEDDWFGEYPFEEVVRLLRGIMSRNSSEITLYLCLEDSLPEISLEKKRGNSMSEVSVLGNYPTRNETNFRRSKPQHISHAGTVDNGGLPLSPSFEHGIFDATNDVTAGKISGENLRNIEKQKMGEGFLDAETELNIDEVIPFDGHQRYMKKNENVEESSKNSMPIYATCSGKNAFGFPGDLSLQQDSLEIDRRLALLRSFARRNQIVRTRGRKSSLSIPSLLYLVKSYITLLLILKLISYLLKFDQGYTYAWWETKIFSPLLRLHAVKLYATLNGIENDLGGSKKLGSFDNCCTGFVERGSSMRNSFNEKERVDRRFLGKYQSALNSSMGDAFFVTEKNSFHSTLESYLSSYGGIVFQKFCCSDDMFHQNIKVNAMIFRHPTRLDVIKWGSNSQGERNLCPSFSSQAAKILQVPRLFHWEYHRAQRKKILDASTARALLLQVVPLSSQCDRRIVSPTEAENSSSKTDIEECSKLAPLQGYAIYAPSIQNGSSKLALSENLKIGQKESESACVLRPQKPAVFETGAVVAWELIRLHCIFEELHQQCSTEYVVSARNEMPNFAEMIMSMLSSSEHGNCHQNSFSSMAEGIFSLGQVAETRRYFLHISLLNFHESRILALHKENTRVLNRNLIIGDWPPRLLIFAIIHLISLNVMQCSVEDQGTNLLTGIIGFGEPSFVKYSQSLMERALRSIVTIFMPIGFCFDSHERAVLIGVQSKTDNHRAVASGSTPSCQNAHKSDILKYHSNATTLLAMLCIARRYLTAENRISCYGCLTADNDNDSMYGSYCIGEESNGDRQNIFWRIGLSYSGIEPHEVCVFEGERDSNAVVYAKSGTINCLWTSKYIAAETSTINTNQRKSVVNSAAFSASVALASFESATLPANSYDSGGRENLVSMTERRHILDNDQTLISEYIRSLGANIYTAGVPSDRYSVSWNEMESIKFLKQYYMYIQLDSIIIAAGARHFAALTEESLRFAWQSTNSICRACENIARLFHAANSSEAEGDIIQTTNVAGIQNSISSKNDEIELFDNIGALYSNRVTGTYLIRKAFLQCRCIYFFVK